MSLQQFKDEHAKSCFNMTLTEAHKRNICICCKEPITQKSFYSRAGAVEYRISGMCEKCFDSTMGE